MSISQWVWDTIAVSIVVTALVVIAVLVIDKFVIRSDEDDYL